MTKRAFAAASMTVALVLALALALGRAGGASAGEGYSPKVGDVAVVFVKDVLPGKGAEATESTKGYLLPRLKTDAIVGDTYLTIDEKGTEIVDIRFNAPKFGTVGNYREPVDQRLHPGLTGKARITPFKVVDALDKGFVAREGDRMVVFWGDVKKGKLAEAKAIYHEKVLAAVRADPSVRNHYLLEDETGTKLVGITFLRGEVVSTPAVASASALLDPLVEKSSRRVNYTIYGLNDE